ncbi:MAG: serine/threonine-protein kinase [Kofleriaceae bacterium]
MNPRDVPTEPDVGEHPADLPTRLGHFEIVGRLGAGGMGLVFEGRDAVLDRRVALKLLHPGRSGSHVAPARLLREAQALAKLSHPNVVTVFEVGMAGSDPFVAMELVEGKTLLEWMRDPHDWRDVLDVFIAVGHGLAAVHALGLVHRDFKPANVLFDARGVPKLGDFGLVGAVEDPRSGSSSPSANPTLTETGSVLGTPAYMAPEQRHGTAVDGRADQYSFAKTLREVLREPIPAALEPILARALADLPDERYPTMGPLLDHLARVRRGRRARWIAAGSAVAVVGAVVLAWGFGRAGSGEETCARPTGRLTTVWSDARRTSLAAHLRTIDPVRGQQRFAAAALVLDRGGERWLDLHVDACRLGREGRQSDALLDRRMSCLDRALVEIDDTVKVLERAGDRATLDDAMRAVVALPALDDCADVATLTELLPRPTNPVQRAEADTLAREAVDIDLTLRTGGTKTTNVLDRARAAVARARALRDPDTLAHALRSLAEVQLELETGEVTLATLREAITTASTAKNDRLVAELWSTLLATLVRYKKAPEAQTLLPAAEAAVARTDSTVEIAVNFLHSQAQVAGASGDPARAQQLLAEALTALDAAGANASDSPLRPLALTIKYRRAVTYGAAGDWKSFVEALRAVVPLATALYGSDHPSLMLMHFNLHIGLRRLGDTEAALVEIREAARIGEARLAPSPGLSDYIAGVGSTLVLLKRDAEAIPYLQRALDMARATMPAGDPRLAQSLGDLVAALHAVDRYDEELPLIEETIALLEKRGGRGDVKLATAYYNRGAWGVQTHHCETALPAFERAIALYQAVELPDEAVDTMYWKAECQLEIRLWAAAVDTTEHILAAKDVPPTRRVLVTFDHARGIWNLGQKAAGIAEARESRDGMERLGLTEEVKIANRWLTARGVKN